jgi:hypothetical protein
VALAPLGVVGAELGQERAISQIPGEAFHVQPDRFGDGEQGFPPAMILIVGVLGLE